jgi:hypothetical protein
MISHTQKCIFIHIPKCAGSSMALWMKNKMKSKPNKSIGLFTHSRLEDFEGRIDNIDDYFKFTFVRNPWARVVSMHSYLKKRRDNGSKPGWYVNDDFNLFVGEQMWNEKNNRRSQLPFSLCSYVADIKNFDFIGKTENLIDDLNSMCKCIGISMGHFPNKNKSVYKHYTEFYDEATQKIIADKYAKDIEIFEYKFGK